MTYQRPTTTESTGTATARPDPGQILVHHMLNWMEARGVRMLPSQGPRTPSEAAGWWLKHMQEPEQPGETREVATVGDKDTRWETGYANRCSQAYLRWADMRPAQREAVVAAVTEDKIPYRGDDFGFFMAVVDETLRMRGMGKAEYLKQNGHVLESRGIPVQSDVQ